MKWLLGLLVLVNVGLLAYYNLDMIAPKPAQMNAQINPEKLKILDQQALEAMPRKMAAITVAPVVETQATSCYEWGNFTASNLPSAQVALAKLGLVGVAKQADTTKADRRFWVYYPPLKNAQLAQQKADEIKALGVGEIFVVQDSQWRHAISFGLFQDEKLATNLLNDLQTRGVKGATKALRSPGKNISSLLVKAVTPEAALELQKVSPEFVGSELKVAACN
ncbi:MAG: sporulation protein [Proteobacteria bacterium ST_bin12]|nr:MAG: sporulation protein [Proteobacteria bacterium ST_bin12]